MTDTPATKRAWRIYHTGGVVVAFARYHVSIATIARALAVSEALVRLTCQNAVRAGDLKSMPPATSEMRGDYLTEVIKLRAENDELKEHLRQLTREQRGEHESLIGYLGLTRLEARLVAALVAHGRLSKDRIYHAMYATAAEDKQPEPKIVDVFVCKIRKKFEPFGLGIETIWGMGFGLTPEVREKLLQAARSQVSPSIVPEAATEAA